MTLGTQAQPHGKLLDYEQFIDHQLERTRARIKFTDIMTAGLTLLVGFLGVLFLEVVLDHMVGLPLPMRRLVLSAGVTVAAIFCAVRIAMPLLRRINGIYAAKTIEDADPAFKNSLINYLELRRYRGQMPKAIMATLQARAVTDLTQVEIDNVVNQQRMLRAFYTLSAVTVIFSLYALFSPKSILDSTRRAFLADVVRPTNTQLVNIKPGNDPELAEVVAGAHVVFSVHVEGVRPEKVLLHYSVDDGKFFAIREFSPGRLMYDPWQITLTNVQQSVEYYLTGGDAESLRYRLKVLPAPTVTSMALDLVFPSYTQVPPRTGIEGGTVEAIEGTEVTVHARTNMPASLATLDISNDTPAPMEIASDDATVLTGRFKVKTSGTYKVNFRTTGNQLNPNPVFYDIFAIPDRPPTARFVQPDKPSIKVPANVNVDLAMTGNDDHGVKDATLHVALGNDKLVSKNMLEGRPPQSEFKAIETLDLAKLRVKPGSTLNYWLVVRDNKEPTSNRVETARQIIEVTEPASPPEKKKFEDSQQKNRDQFEPTAASNGDGESGPDKQPPPQAGQDGGQKNETGNGPPQDETQTKNGEQEGNQGTSTIDEPNPENRKDGGANNDGGQLSPEDQRMEDKLKSVMNEKKAGNPSGDQAKPANAQPKDGNSQPGNSGNANAPPKSGNSKGGIQDSAKGRSNDSQRPTAQDSGQSNPSTAPPQPGDPRSSDPSSQVQRADRSGNQPPSANGQQANNDSNTTPNQPADRDQANPRGNRNDPIDTTPADRRPRDSRGNERTDASSPQGARNDNNANGTKSEKSEGRNAGTKTGDQNADSNSSTTPGEDAQSRDTKSGNARDQQGNPANKSSQGDGRDRSSAAKNGESQKNKGNDNAPNETGSPTGGDHKDGTKGEGNDSSSATKTDGTRDNKPNGDAANRDSKDGANGEGNDRSSSTKNRDRAENAKTGDAANEKGEPSASNSKDGAKAEGNDRSSSNAGSDSQKSAKSGEGTKQSGDQSQDGAKGEGNDRSSSNAGSDSQKSAKSGESTKQSGDQSSETNKDDAKGQGSDRAASATKSGEQQQQKNSTKGQTSTPKGAAGKEDPDAPGGSGQGTKGTQGQSGTGVKRSSPDQASDRTDDGQAGKKDGTGEGQSGKKDGTGEGQSGKKDGTGEGQSGKKDGAGGSDSAAKSNARSAAGKQANAGRNSGERTAANVAGKLERVFTRKRWPASSHCSPEIGRSDQDEFARARNELARARVSW